MLCSQPKAAHRHVQGTTSNAPEPIPAPDDVHLTDYASGLGCACKIRFYFFNVILCFIIIL